MIYSIIPAKYLITLEYCYVQMVGCQFYLDKIRNELVDEMEDATSDKAALFYAKNINNLTRILTTTDELFKIMYDYMSRDLVDILMKMSTCQDTIWYKNICETKDGYKILYICFDQINTLKLQACDILNNDFGLDIKCKARTLDGTLNADCLDN